MGESYQVDPWLIDDPTQPKRFTLAGFAPTEKDLPEQMDKQKQEVINMIKSLGGEYVETDIWDNSVTHVIAKLEPEKEGLPEKVMGAIAGGKLVLTKRYVEKSFKAGHFLPGVQPYLNPRDAVISSRKNYHQSSPGSGGMFTGMQVLVLMREERKREVYRRIIQSGGGECDSSTVGSLMTSSNLQLPQPYSHVFLDPRQFSLQHVRTLMEKSKNSNVKFLSYKFLFLSLKKGSLCSEDDHDPLLQAKNGSGNKRSLAEDADSAGAKKMKAQETVVVTLSDDDDLDDCEIVDESGPSKAPTRTRTHVPTVVIDDDIQICVEEEDDDIEVLEELIAKNSERFDRRYVERRKARSVKNILEARVEALEFQLPVVETVRSRTPPIEDRDSDREEIVENDEDHPETDHELEKGSCEEEEEEEEEQTTAVLSEVEEENPQEDTPAPELLYLEYIRSSLDEDSEDTYRSVSQVGFKDSENAEKEAEGRLQKPVFSSPATEVEATENGVRKSQKRSETEEQVVTESPPTPDQGSILNRILATIVKRYKISNEGLAIGNINSRTPKYDKHHEGLSTPSLVSLRHIEPDFRTDIDGERVLSVISSLHRLSLETTSTHRPSAYLLHVVLSQLLLRGEDEIIKTEAKKYLEKFLFLHLTSKREESLWLVLSACRTLQDRKSFRKFDINNIHDQHACWLFFSDTISQVIKDYESCEMFLTVFVKMLHNDFQFWWKHCKGKTNFPIFYYLLGGSESNILKRIESSVLKLYQASLSLKNSSMLSQVRKIVSMSALLLSHIDSSSSQVWINSGAKTQLADRLSSVLENSQLSSRELYTELSLLQPSWLSALVCHNLLRSLYDITNTRSLKEILKSETAHPPVDLRRQYLLELNSSKICSFQQAHNIFRANWFYFRSPQKEFKIFKYMKLEEEELDTNKKIIMYEEIGIKLKNIVENVNTIRNIANNNNNEDLIIKGPISALFFKMTWMDKF